MTDIIISIADTIDANALFENAANVSGWQRSIANPNYDSDDPLSPEMIQNPVSAFEFGRQIWKMRLEQSARQDLERLHNAQVAAIRDQEDHEFAKQADALIASAALNINVQTIGT